MIRLKRAVGFDRGIVFSIRHLTKFRIQMQSARRWSPTLGRGRKRAMREECTARRWGNCALGISRIENSLELAKVEVCGHTVASPVLLASARIEKHALRGDIVPL